MSRGAGGATVAVRRGVADATAEPNEEADGWADLDTESDFNADPETNAELEGDIDGYGDLDTESDLRADADDDTDLEAELLG